jgi:peptidyl-tRNA hydrolase
MSNTRLTVVIRRDLNLSPGLLAAQVAHISDAFMRTAITNRVICEKHDLIDEEKQTIPDIFKPHELEWMKDPYLSVLAVNGYEELLYISEQAQEANLKVINWVDVIPSEPLQRSIKVWVGLSIGPDDFDKIKLVTGTLPLY